MFSNMNKSTFSSLLALEAGPAIIHTFDQLVSPMHASILAQGRDALLPKLVSGALRVGDRKGS